MASQISQNEKIYRDLVKYYKEADTTNKKHSVIDREVAEIWKNLKKSKEFPQIAREEVAKWKTKANQKVAAYDNKFWSKFCGNKNEGKNDSPAEVVQVVSRGDVIGADEEMAPEPDSGVDDEEMAAEPSVERNYPRPAEDKLKLQLTSLNQDITHLLAKRNSGLATDAQLKELKQKQLEAKSKENALKALTSSRKRQQKKRQRERMTIQENPEIAEQLNRKTKIGRPTVEESQPGLLGAIVDIAMFGAAADERRRSESLRSIKTLPQMRDELLHRGYNLSLQTLYHRLLPRRSNTVHGKRHINTVKVRLKRATNDLHRGHVDTDFCRTTIRNLEELASLLGPNQVIFLSQDDKARIPLGITAANKQAPILMHLDYQVKLPDHDWVVADRHKLIPSVYAIMEVKPEMMGDPRAVSYSGPTFITIRSGKHCKSTASSHARDFDRMISDENHSAFCVDETTGLVKPVIIIVVDGGPDENPRYEKVINEAVEHFLHYDLDALFVATNAPGRSAFNRVERRMAPLSRELCGLILPHDHFGSHLNERGQTVDKRLEMQNFEHAGKALAEVWNTLVLDGYPVKATYITPNESDKEGIYGRDPEWKTRHVRESHYFLQIVKCDDRNCCMPLRGTYRNIMPRFLPAPLYLEQATLLPSVTKTFSNKFTSLLVRLQIQDEVFRNQNSKEIPYDISCPSITEILPTRICTSCGIQFASVKSLKAHKPCRHSALNAPDVQRDLVPITENRRPVRVAARRQREKMLIWSSRLNDMHVDWVDEEEVEPPNVEAVAHEDAPDNLVNMEDHMSVPWEIDE